MMFEMSTDRLIITAVVTGRVSRAGGMTEYLTTRFHGKAGTWRRSVTRETPPGLLEPHNEHLLLGRCPESRIDLGEVAADGTPVFVNGHAVSEETMALLGTLLGATPAIGLPAP